MGHAALSSGMRQVVSPDKGGPSRAETELSYLPCSPGGKEVSFPPSFLKRTDEVVTAAHSHVTTSERSATYTAQGAPACEPAVAEVL